MCVLELLGVALFVYNVVYGGWVVICVLECFVCFGFWIIRGSGYVRAGFVGLKVWTDRFNLRCFVFAC